MADYEVKGLADAIQIRIDMTEAEVDPKVYTDSSSNRSYPITREISKTTETIEAKAERLLRLANLQM